MRKLIIVLFLATFSVAGYSQSKWDGFFKPVEQNLFAMESNSRDKAVTNVWLIRPAIAVTAIQLNWNKDTKQMDASALSSAGMGIGYQHFVEVNGSPYNNYGFNALLLLGGNIDGTTPASMSLAVTGSLFQFVNIGGLYNFSTKTFGILTGVTIKF